MIAAILSMLVLLGGGVGAMATPQWVSEEALRRMIEQRLASQSICGVAVSVSDRNVTLTGTVSSLWEKTHAREEAWNANTQGAVFDEVVVARSKSDEELVDLIDRRIRDFVFFTMFDDVEAAVNDGIVTLTGTVTAWSKALVFAELTSQVPGIQDVITTIQRPLATHRDRDLRGAIAARIYGDPLFRKQAFVHPPPVHILVSAAQVTLAGTVHTDAERCAAERITRETIGVRSLENKLRVNAERPDVRNELSLLPMSKPACLLQ